jgi:hypothetical protein
LVALAVIAAGTVPAHAQAATFRAATARVEITPPAIGFPDYFRAGYGSDGPVHVSSGSPLFATALMLVDAAGSRWVLVSADILSFPSSVVRDIDAAASSQFGIPPERLLLTGTHTHSGPVLVDQPNPFITYNIVPGSADDQLVRSFTQAFEDRILNLLSSLVGTPTVEVSATLGFGVANAGLNRSAIRPSVVEPTVPVLTLRQTAGGSIVAVVFSYAVHPVTLGAVSTWSGDYAAAAVSNVESQLAPANPGVRALFLQGASGDQNPSKGTAEAASMLAAQVMAVVNGADGTGSAAVSEPEAAGLRDVAAPLDITVSDATLRAHYANVLATTSSLANRNHAQLMVNQLDTGTLRRAMTVRVTAWRFGAPADVKPLALIAVSGEPVADFPIGFERILGTTFRTWTVSQTNGHPGYVASDEVLARGDGCPTSSCFYGGYESGWAVVESGQRYPSQSSITYNDGLAAPLAPGADNAVCQAATAVVTGTAADCSSFTPGRVIPHPRLANTGPALATWTDSAGLNHLEVLALGTDACLHHRGWVGAPNGATTGTWTGWDPANLCGSIVGPSAASAWVDAAGRAHIEIAVRTGDGSLYHGRCVGDPTGCFNRAWTWTRIANAADGFVEPPEFSVWKQQDGRPRIDAFAVRGTNRCLYHQGWIGSDQNGAGAWSGVWSLDPGCGGIVGPAAAGSWRGAGGAMNHDVFVRTSDGLLFGDRCTGTEASCTWSGWFQLSRPPGVVLADAPAYAVTDAGTQRFDLYVRANDNCVWHAGWTTTAIPATPGWQRLSGCGLVSRPGVGAWLDSFGRRRAAVVALDRTAGGPLWWRAESSRTGSPQDDVWMEWDDIADPVGAVSAP